MEWAIVVVIIIALLTPSTSGDGDSTNTSVCFWSECVFESQEDNTSIKEKNEDE